MGVLSMYIKRNYNLTANRSGRFSRGVLCEHWTTSTVHYLPIIRMSGKIAHGVESSDFELENEEELKALEKAGIFLKTKWEF